MPAQGRRPMQWLPTWAPRVESRASSRKESSKHLGPSWAASWEVTVPRRMLSPSLTPISTALRLWAYSFMMPVRISSRLRPVRSSVSSRTTSTTRVSCSLAMAIISLMVSGIFAWIAALISDIGFILLNPVKNKFMYYTEPASAGSA